MLSTLFRKLGYVPAAKYASATDRLRRAEARAEKFARIVEGARAEVQDSRAKLRAAEKALRHAEGTAAKQSERIAALRSELERSKRRPAREYSTFDLERLQKRLADAERELSIWREHLMAVDVKLDILEGAANVLDGRTRAVVGRRHASERGAAV